MATGASTSATTHVIGSAVIELARSNRTGAPFSVRISTKSNNGVFTRDERDPRAEGPSCIFVGPIETARKETLEALYRQARDAYYSGNPLIVDDMFDRVELKLRSYGSKYVVKYPRCSLRRQSTYADAEDAFSSGYYYSSQPSQFLAILNGMLFMALGSVIGYPIASASVKALEGLWRNDLVAVKGACPNCGEEVFGFARSNQSNYSPHRADCHVCECSLEFRTKVEQSISIPGRRLVYGRIYLIKQRGRSHHQRWK
ncbi:PGR5-like protein 1B, chloroplastic isoform X3 [Rhododendron vialii]|uniref:PGR5-like protein 1B, chloroplastic isoform X3 n=1 Tax=Rhododendron vialii TaxID=182163 RepID=UPI00265EF3B6|nr:PGR5-like protein 1B, chloroplastic isoform X3 [Rhododendron vialii]